MLLSTGNPVFVAFTIACLTLVLHLAFLWNWSGVVRGQTRTTANPEDARGRLSVASDPPDVQRVMRVYANAMSLCTSFFIVGLLFVASGGGLLFGQIAFGAFVGARLVYAVVYLRGIQPWRSISYTVSCLALLALMVDIVVLLVRR